MKCENYIYPAYVSTFHVGEGQKLHLSEILKFQQEAGEQQLLQYNIGYRRMMDNNLAFVTTNATVVINEHPMLGQKIKLATWNRGAHGAKYFRAYNWYGEDGRLMIEACTAFALVDFKEHKLLRPSALGCDMPADFDRANAAGNPSKLRFDESLLKPNGVKTVRFSELDGNSHLNNSYYADMVADFMPGKMAGKIIRSFSIDYLKEAVEGDEIAVCAYQNGGSVTMCGKHGGGVCFKASAEIAEI